MSITVQVRGLGAPEKLRAGESPMPDTLSTRLLCHFSTQRGLRPQQRLPRVHEGWQKLLILMSHGFKDTHGFKDLISICPMIYG